MFNNVTKKQKKILDVSVKKQEPNQNEIEQNKAFLCKQLVLVTLPHSDPGDVEGWARKNGNVTLQITPGVDVNPNTQEIRKIGLPYGTLPRLLMCWLTTEAIRTKSKRIELGGNLSEFMKKLGLTSSGGSKGDITRLRNQMERLFRSHISFRVDASKDNDSRERWLNMQIAASGDVWWENLDSNSGKWKSWVELGEKFYEAICAAPVPLDMEILKAIKHSPLLLDLYKWATWRSYTTIQSGKNQFIPWNELEKQFGSNYKDQKHFIEKVRKAWTELKLVYTGLDADIVEGGITFFPTTKTSVKIKKKTLAPQA